MDATSRDGSAPRRVLLIGHDELADAAEQALRGAGADVTRLREPSDGELRDALCGEIDAVVVLAHDDHVSLRISLIVQNVRPGIPLTVTVFARDVASQLERAVENSRVVSLADLVAPTLAGPCLDERLLSVIRTRDGHRGVEATEDGPRVVPLRVSPPSLHGRLLANLRALVDPFEHSARIMLAGLFGFLLILLIDTVAMAVVLSQALPDAFYGAAKTIATVGPNPHVEQGPGWFKVFSATTMLAALGFTAVFTAGLIERLLDRRLTAIVGSRVAPRKGHVVVVGLGQVGLRLCMLLRELGVPVLALDADPDNYNVARAKHYGVPVVIGRGGSQFLLRRLSLERARALAAVTRHEVENISVVVAALSRREDLRTVLRAGRGDVTNETRSLFSIGVVRDIYRIGGTLLAAAALGSKASQGFLHERTVYLVGADGEMEPFADQRDSEDGPAAAVGDGDPAAAARARD